MYYVGCNRSMQLQFVLSLIMIWLSDNKEHNSLLKQPIVTLRYVNRFTYWIFCLFCATKKPMIFSNEPNFNFKYCNQFNIMN